MPWVSSLKPQTQEKKWKGLISVGPSSDPLFNSFSILSYNFRFVVSPAMFLSFERPPLSLLRPLQRDSWVNQLSLFQRNTKI